MKCSLHRSQEAHFCEQVQQIQRQVQETFIKTIQEEALGDCENIPSNRITERLADGNTCKYTK